LQQCFVCLFQELQQTHVVLYIYWDLDLVQLDFTMQFLHFGVLYCLTRCYFYSRREIWFCNAVFTRLSWICSIHTNRFLSWRSLFRIWKSNFKLGIL